MSLEKVKFRGHKVAACHLSQHAVFVLCTEYLLLNHAYAHSSRQARVYTQKHQLMFQALLRSINQQYKFPAHGTLSPPFRLQRILFSQPLLRPSTQGVKHLWPFNTLSSSTTTCSVSLDTRRCALATTLTCFKYACKVDVSTCIMNPCIEELFIATLVGLRSF